MWFDISLRGAQLESRESSRGGSQWRRARAGGVRPLQAAQKEFDKFTELLEATDRLDSAHLTKDEVEKPTG